MTAQQFNEIKWSFSSHSNINGVSSTVYRADTPFPLLKCERVAFRTTIHYMLKGKIIKTKEKLLKEIERL